MRNRPPNRTRKARPDSLPAPVIDTGEVPVRSGTFKVAPEAKATAGEGPLASHATETELVALRRFKDDAIAMLVDELNSPLAAIMMNLDFALTELDAVPSHVDTMDARSALAETRTAGAKLFRTIANLLDLARSDDGRLRPRCVTTDVESLFARVLEPFRAEAAALRVTLKTEVTVGRAIHVDPDMLGRVLSTLVDSALRYPAAGGSLVLTARHGHGVAVVLSVTVDRDAGAIHPRGHAHHFCRVAVEAHGGSIGLVGDPAAATSYRIELPDA